MIDPYLGEIRLFGFDFPPNGWAECNGSLLSISQNQSLYSILGTTYGGDGRTTFALPDLRGRVPISFSSSHSQGQEGGTEASILTTAQIPAHTHTMQATTNDAQGINPTDQVLAQSVTNTCAKPDNLVSMNVTAVGNAGDGSGFKNMQPFLTINFCIAITGVFPPRN